RPAFMVAGWALSPAWVAFALSAAWWLTRGSIAVGLVVSVATALLMFAAQHVSYGSTAAWLAWGVGFFVVGWLIQFVGHYYEGRKPAFVDDLVGLLVGPMFVVGEALFAAGLCRPLAQEIERRTGPTLIRDLAHPVA
ncbi:MAG TPA: Mpo1-like protein, partial [Burkholderiaceae bacterium]|nr:Mpo1-like protein [Burkholderiaceae bacterium]